MAISTGKIERYRGDTAPISVSIYSETTQEAQDVTSWSFLLTVSTKRNPGSSAFQVFQSTGTITNAASGSVEFPILSTQPEEAGTYYYDIQSTDSAGKVKTIAKGAYVVEQDVTK